MLKQITTKLKIKKLHSSARLPEQQTFGSVGYDIYSIEDTTVERGHVRTFLPKGTRVGQLIVRKSHFPGIEEADTLGETQRGSGGFGSTGLK